MSVRFVSRQSASGEYPRHEILTFDPDTFYSNCGGDIVEPTSLREPRIHGDPVFPFHIYFVVLTKGPLQQTVNLHWHTETEFVLVTKGSVHLQVGTRTLDIAEGSAAMVNSEELHSMRGLDDQPSECYAIVFDLELLNSSRYDLIQSKFIDPLLEKRYRLPVLVSPGSPWSDAVLQELKSILRTGANDTFAAELAIKSSLYRIVYELFASGVTNSQNCEEPYGDEKLAQLKDVLTYIEQHIHQELRIKDLSAQAHMSEGYFCRFFRAAIKQRPVQYINARRIQFAVRMLQDPTKSITTIASDLGFNNVSYFIRVFRSFKQCTPAEYRHLLLSADSGESSARPSVLKREHSLSDHPPRLTVTYAYYSMQDTAQDKRDVCRAFRKSAHEIAVPVVAIWHVNANRISGICELRLEIVSDAIKHLKLVLVARDILRLNCALCVLDNPFVVRRY